MTTRKNYIDGSYRNPPAVIKNDTVFELWKSKVDFSYLTGTAADVIQVLELRPKTWVYNVWLNVLTAATANGKIDIGYGSDTDYWGAAMPIDTVGVVTHKMMEAGGGIRERSLLANTPLYFATTDTIDIIPTKDEGGVASIVAGVVEICVLLTKVK
jgi:hypothetical protein